MMHMFKIDSTPVNYISQGGKAFKPLNFGTKIDMGFQYIASENLSGTIFIEAGGGDGSDYFGKWGTGPKMMSGTDGSPRFYIKHAYLDWLVPSTKISVRMGLQTWLTPHWVNGPIGHAAQEVAGVVVNVPVNQMFSAQLAWFRGYADFAITQAMGTAGGAAYYGYNGRDYFYLGGTLRGQGFIVQPWAMYDRESSHNATLDNGLATPLPGAHTWMVGIGGQVSMFNPFVIEFNAAYGKQHNDGKIWWSNANSNGVPGFSPNQKGKGFALKANVGYKTAFGTPTLDVWYYSGDKRGEWFRTGHIPHNGGSNNIALLRTNSARFVGDGVGNPRVTGTWGAALSWKNFSFIKNATHTAVVSYWRGTNNVRYGNVARPIEALNYMHRFAYMTTEDSYVELDLINTWQIYPQLSFGLELAYGWANWKETAIDKASGFEMKNPWRITGGFIYNF